MVQLMDKIPAY